MYDQSVHEYGHRDKPYGDYSIDTSAVITKTNQGNVQALSVFIYIPEVRAFYAVRDFFSKKDNRKSSIFHRYYPMIVDEFHIKEITPGLLWL